MKRFMSLWMIALPLLFACQRGVPVEEAALSINEGDFGTKLAVIADDSMLGRGNLTPSIVQTAEWIAKEFRRYGLKPGGDDGTFIQHYEIKRMGVDFEGSSARIEGGPSLEFGKDLSLMRAGGGGEVSGGVIVVAGDFSEAGEPAAEALAGKHVLVIPPSEAPMQGRRRMRFPRGLMQAEVASLLLVDRSSDEDWAAAVERARSQTVNVTPWSSGAGVPMISIREASLAPILASHGLPLERIQARAARGPVVEEVPDLTLTLNVATRDEGSFMQPNVVGILEGSDPELKNEYVLFSAHMDHVGTGRPNEEGDSIYNGADDDGSGTIGVVEAAEAFSMLAERPRRSMIFLTVSGEEAGLWGSRYFAENPPVPLDQIVADLNADMISRNAHDTIVVIGKEHSDLGETLARVSAAHPELGLTAMDDIWPEQNFYRRSDHFNFARRGVPILFFFCGTHEDYHRPTDEVSKVDLSKATRTTQLMFYLGLEVANADAKPQWNPESYEEIVDMGGQAG